MGQSRYASRIRYNLIKELKAEKGHSGGCKEVQRARIFQAEGRESRRWVQNKPWREQYDRAEVRREATARRKFA